MVVRLPFSTLKRNEEANSRTCPSCVVGHREFEGVLYEMEPGGRKILSYYFEKGGGEISLRLSLKDL